MDKQLKGYWLSIAKYPSQARALVSQRPRAGIFRDTLSTSILRVLLKAIQVPHWPQQIQICNHYFAKKNPENEFWKRAITHEKVGQPWRKSNLICSSSYGSLLPTFIQIKQWDGQVGNEHFFPTWASLSQWGIKKNFIEKCGKCQDNNFPKKFFLISPS